MATKASYKTLIHNGVIFPEEYKSQGNFIVNGEKLSPLAEEQFVAFAKLRDTDYVKDKVFVKNFYKCFSGELSSKQKEWKFPEDYSKLIDRVMIEKEKVKEEKAAYNKLHKEEIAKQKQEIKDKYGFALVDNKKVPLASYIIEGPGIMMARGNSPIRGMWKYRIQPEDITINFVGPKEQIPQAPEGHHWKKVVSEKDVCYTATYCFNIGNYCEGKLKGVNFSAVSDFRKDGEFDKFEKSRNLVKNWDKFEKHIMNGMHSKDEKVKQAALVAYLIYKSGIRVGNEHDDKTDNGTVGASTLLCKNIKLL